MYRTRVLWNVIYIVEVNKESQLWQLIIIIIKLLFLVASMNCVFILLALQLFCRSHYFLSRKLAKYDRQQSPHKGNPLFSFETVQSSAVSCCTVQVTVHTNDTLTSCRFHFSVFFICARFYVFYFYLYLIDCQSTISQRTVHTSSADFTLCYHWSKLSLSILIKKSFQKS